MEYLSEEDVDVKKIIKDIEQTDLSGSNEEQGKFAQMIKGLAFSDDPLSNEFMKKVDQAVTKISKEVLKKEESIEEISVPGRHQLKIAKDTMKMSDAGAMIMGGMTKAEAREILRKAGYSDKQIASMEESNKKEDTLIEVQEDVVIAQEDGTKIILEKGDRIRVLEVEKKWKDMTDKEKKKAYNVAIKSGDVEDTFEGFSKSMSKSIFNTETGEPIEVA